MIRREVESFLNTVSYMAGHRAQALGHGRQNEATCKYELEVSDTFIGGVLIRRGLTSLNLCKDQKHRVCFLLQFV